MKPSSPYQFDEFFSSGLNETVSPFLTPTSRNWGKNLGIKTSLLSAVFLLLSFLFSFSTPPLSSLFLAAVFFLAGVPAILNALEDLKSLEININMLMTLAAFLSLFIGSGIEGALLLVLFELSGAMEEAVTKKTKGSLHRLRTLSPTIALVLDEDGSYFEKSVKEIEVGTRILVKAGEIVPLDGIVREGTSSVNLVHLTGESLPVVKKVDMEVPAGARNLEASLTVEITRKSADSTLSRIIDLITKAAEAKPTVQRFLDRFGKKYASTIILLTFLFIFLLPLLLQIPFWGMEGSIYRSLAFLIAASPCALIIATPTAYLSAISSCASQGILLKGGIVLDALASCRKIFFDKTGTLTTGQLRCVAFEPLDGKASIPLLTALGIASSMEKNVVHPIAEAIQREAKEKKAPFISLLSYEAIPGYGLQGNVSVEGKKEIVFLGLPEFVLGQVEEKKRASYQEMLKQKRNPGQISSLLLVGSSLFHLQFSDELRENAAEMLQALKKEGIDTIMITGDHQVSAEMIAQKLGMTQVYADLRPEDKLALIDKFSQKEGLAMVGDGINDAPSLARANVGISLGKVGSSTAHDASDIILLNDEIFLVSFLVKKAQKTLKIVKQNLCLALAVILFATTPALLGLIPLWLAVVLHEGGTVLVGLNSLRLLKNK